MYLKKLWIQSPLSFITVIVLTVGLLLSLVASQGRQDVRQRAAGDVLVGYQTWNGSLDSFNNNKLTATQVMTAADGGTLQSMSVYVGAVDSVPNNHARVAIYSDNGNNAPGTLLGESNSKVLTANSWNTMLLSNVTITATTKYWLAFTLDGGATQIGRGSGTGNTASIVPSTYGTWPTSFGFPPSQTETKPYAIYMTYTGATATPTNTPTPTPAGPISQGALPSHLDAGPAKVYVNNLILGAQYRIVVSGTFLFSNITSPILTSDAQWNDIGSTPLCYCLQTDSIFWNGNRFLRAQDGGAVKPDHTYTFLWTADSTQLEMYIGDSKYTDNSGALNYAMYLKALPSPTPTNTPTPTPTNTPTPLPTATPTPVPTTKFSVDLLLHGLGKAGDSANPGNGGNANLLHTQRSVSIDVFNSQNQLLLSKQGTVTFNPTSGSFIGTIDMGTTLTSGLSTVKIKTNQFLKALVPGIQTITVNVTNKLPQTTLISGDINNDNVVNIADYNILIGCYSDFLPPVACSTGNAAMADLTDDGSVNQFDYNLFLRELTNIGGQ